MGKTIQITLASARVNAGLTQSEVAKKIGVTARTIWEWENEKSEPRISQAYMLSECYNMPLDNIFFGNKSQ
ncbi:MAG: helix-turn-helix domain-containing protein [Anaerovoracaceae bacterium]